MARGAAGRRARPVLPARACAACAEGRAAARQQDPQALVAALRALAAEPPEVSLAHLELRFPPVSQFLDRFRALLGRRRGSTSTTRSPGLSRIEQAVAFLALLELRRAGEISLEQAAPFAPIRVARAAVEQEEVEAWSARSA